MSARGRRMAHLVMLTAFFEQLAWLPIFTAVRVADLGIAYGQTAYSLANLTGNVAAGHLADRLGRRIVAGASLLAAAATALLHLAAAAAAEPGAWVVARLAHGLAVAGAVPSAFALVADGSARRERGGAMARAGAAIAVASILASAGGGIMVRRLGVAPTVGALAAVLAAVGLLALVALPGRGTREAEREGGPAPAREAPLPGALPLALVAAAALMFGQSVLSFAVPLRVRALGAGAQLTGALFAAFGVAALLAFVVLGRASDRWGRRAALGAGLTLVAASQVTLALVTAGPAMAAAMAVYGLGFGLAFPAIPALASDGAPAERRGLAMGLLGATFSLGAAAGPVMAGLLAPALPPFGTAAAVVTAALAAVAGSGSLMFEQDPVSRARIQR